VSKLEKLLAKLENESISASELYTLLGQLGWVHDHTTGSHKYWMKDGKRLTFSPHGKDLARYQIKQAKKAIGEKK
jgi:predicted RNA binding protein YcfA (HicA-like mRNA interferase family)